MSKRRLDARRAARIGGALTIAAACTSAAAAADLAVAPQIAYPDPSGFFKGWEFHVQAEAGIDGNPANPANGLDGKSLNFGHLFTDHANEPVLNQVLLTLTKPIDPKETGYAVGFTGEALYGSDMRYNHFLGIDAFAQGDQRDQINILQAFVPAHLPWFTAGGVDVKVGLFSSPMGYETLDPSTSPFYSHSYTFNYGVTFNDTGILTTTHISRTLDLWLGVDTGNQTTFGATFPGNGFGDFGDPNGAPAGYVGFGLNNLLDNKLTVLALSHIGPEQPPNADPVGYARDLRFYDDVTFTYKATDKLTSITEFSYDRDSFGFGAGPAEFYSGVETLIYAYDKLLTFSGRGEIARDTKNFFVVTPLTNTGVQAIEELFATPTLAGAPNAATTYGAITLGVAIKPDAPKPLSLVQLRPEIRYERILDGDPLYDGSRNQFTFGGDLTIGF